MSARENSNLDTYQALVSTFGSFLTVAIHTILYERNIYPRTSFLTARKYNFPVRQNRHPDVCKWINDAVTQVEAEMLKGSVARVAVVIFSPEEEPLERFMFDVSAFPKVPIGEHLTQFENTEGEPPALPDLVDVEEQLRACMMKLSFCGSKLGELPDDSSFTVCIELRDEGQPPIDRTQAWIPAQPSLQSPDNRPGFESLPSSQRGSDLGGVKTTPVRTVDAGRFLLELWIEEGKSKGRALG